MSYLSPPERDVSTLYSTSQLYSGANMYGQTMGRAQERGDSFTVPVATGNPWESCLSPLLEEDKLKCDAWRDEVQNLLLFVSVDTM